MVAGTRAKEHYRCRWSMHWLVPRHQVGRWFKAPHGASQVAFRHWTTHVPSPSHSPLICDKSVITPYLLLGSTIRLNAQEVPAIHLVWDTTECNVRKERELLTQQDTLQRCPSSPPHLPSVTNTQPHSVFAISLGNVLPKAMGSDFSFSGDSTIFSFFPSALLVLTVASACPKVSGTLERAYSVDTDVCNNCTYFHIFQATKENHVFVVEDTVAKDMRLGP